MKKITVLKEQVEEVNNIVNDIITQIQNELIEIDSLTEEEQSTLTKKELNRFFLKNCHYGNDDVFTLMIDVENHIPTDLIEDWKNKLYTDDDEEGYIAIYDWWNNNIRDKVYDRLKEIYDYEYPYLRLDFGLYEGWSLIIDEKDNKISRYEDK